jgi:predicted nucleotidyltransferase
VATIVERMATIAKRLGPLKDDVVFVGGAVLSLLIDDAAGTPVRPTDDIDVIIDVSNRTAHARLEEQLRGLGFKHDTSQGAPLCRWIVDAIVVDVMPADGEILGLRNIWYPQTIAHAIEREIVDGLTIRIAAGPYFVAMKLEAFADRGGGNFASSPDLEDLISVIDGNDDIVDEIRGCNEDLKQYLSDQLVPLLLNQSFIDALPFHLGGDQASQERLPLVVSRLRQVANRQ